MKLPATLLLFTAIIGVASIVRAEPSPVSVRVDQENKTETSKDHLTKTARRTLKVNLSNSTKAEVSVKVKYTFFGHGVASHDIVIVDSGDRDATIKPSGSEVVETPATSVSFTDEHFDAKAKKKVEGTGNKIVGYAVQVFIADKMVAEAYDPAPMKDQVGKAPVYKKEEPKK